MVALLIAEGADVNYKDADGRSTLYVLALENQLPAAELLLTHGADVIGRDLEYRSTLHVAAWQGHVDMVKLLIRHGADVNGVDCEYRTALQSAAWQGHGHVVQLLLEQGAVVDARCNQGATALCIASQEGHQDVVKVLLAFKANPNHSDRFGRTASRVALKNGHYNVVKMLEQGGANPLNGGAPERRKAADSMTTSGVSMTTDSQASAASSHLGSVPASTESGVHLMTSSYDSPCSTFEHRKFSSKSSGLASNTASTDQSSGSGGGGVGGTAGSLRKEPLTFTQQLQQCSRHKHRPLSKALTPVNEPAVLSPCTDRTASASPASDVQAASATRSHSSSPKPSSVRMRSPRLEYSSVRSSGGGSAHSSQRSLSAAGDAEEPIWRKQPEVTQHVVAKSSVKHIGKFPEMPPMARSGITMGQLSLSLKSPEARQKYNASKTNPNFNANNSGGICMNGYENELADLSDLDIDDAEGFDDDDADVYSVKKASRPSGLDLKKETPL